MKQEAVDFSITPTHGPLSLSMQPAVTLPGARIPNV